jgi:hypothetical protein
MAKNHTDYKLFFSAKRGERAVEEELEKMINKMQTPENLRKMAKAVASGWRKENTLQRPSGLDFSKFESKLNEAKKEFFGDDEISADRQQESRGMDGQSKKSEK